MNKIKESLQNSFSEKQWSLIKEVLKGKTKSWYDLAVQFNIKPEGTLLQRSKAANDIWRRYRDKIQNIQELVTTPLNVQSPMSVWQEPHRDVVIGPGLRGYPLPQTTLPIKPKRLFYDIETSYNIVKAWRAGYNLNINSEDIIKERAIITIAYKWEGDNNVTVLSWNNGCDKKLLEEFIKVLNEADEIVGHNIDKFDTKFIMGRALVHGIKALPKYQSTDTLKLARKHFMLNSNKLDYIAQLLDIGHKTRHRGMPMWDDIILRNDPKALEEMIEYNVKDVMLTEEVYFKLAKYSLPKVNHTAKQREVTHGCPNCGEEKATLAKTYVTTAGTKTRLVSCNKCKTDYTVSDAKYKKYYEENNA